MEAVRRWCLKGEWRDSRGAERCLTMGCRGRGGGVVELPAVLTTSKGVCEIGSSLVEKVRETGDSTTIERVW